MTEPLSSFETPLDPYETRVLELRTTVLQRIREEGAPDDPLLLLIISSLARIPESEGDRVAAVVADLVVGLRLSPQERQKTYTSVAGVKTARRDSRASGLIADKIGQKPANGGFINALALVGHTAVHGLSLTTGGV